MAVVLLVLAVVGIPLLVLLKNQYGTKKGCGRGCSTCGNREICHGKNGMKKKG